MTESHLDRARERVAARDGADDMNAKIWENPGLAYVGTCDAGSVGFCNDDTVAIVLTDDGWLSMCAQHARAQLEPLEAAPDPTSHVAECSCGKSLISERRIRIQHHADGSHTVTYLDEPDEVMGALDDIVAEARRLVKQRRELIAAGVDPADLKIPLDPSATPTEENPA